jgi:hypothetical protein
MRETRADLPSMWNDLPLGERGPDVDLFRCRSLNIRPLFSFPARRPIGAESGSELA